MVLGWAISVYYFHFSEEWQWVTNTGKTLITFLMVFSIQKSKNKASHALELKLNEFVAAHEFACNRLVDVRI